MDTEHWQPLDSNKMVAEYSLEQLDELLQHIEMECGGEYFAPLKPLLAAAYKQSLAHERLQKVIKHALVRVLVTGQNNLIEKVKRNSRISYK